MSEKKTGEPAFPAGECYELKEEWFRVKGMTPREYAAIWLRAPDSGTDWLDEMIRKSLRDEFAAKAMQANRSRASAYVSWDDLAKDAYELADAMLRAREAK